MLTAEETVHLIADAYYAAALSGTTMRSATEALEAIRSTLASGEDHFKVWDTMDQQIGRAEDKQLEGVLSKLRERVVGRINESEIGRLREMFERDAQAGWVEWLSAYTESLNCWRLRLCLALCDAGFAFPIPGEEDVINIQRSTRYLQQGRFIEAYDVFIYLAQQELLSTIQRARMYVIASDIQLYQFTLPEKAKELLQCAEELAPDEYLVKRGWGTYWLQQNDFDSARQWLQKAIKQDSQKVAAYTSMGDCFDRQNSLDDAEEWYREAVRVQSGDVSGYIRLVRLYGRSEMLDTHEAKLLPLLEKAIAIEPDDTYDDYIEMGFVYQQNKKYEQAYDWYNKAIALDGARLNGYINIGYAALEDKNFERAEEDFQEALKVAPESIDGYWGMAWLYEQRELWQEALHWYEKGLPLRKEWEGRIRGKIGEMWLKLEHYQESEEALIRALRSEPDNQTVVDLLEELAIKYYQAQKDPVAALRIYETTRQIKGQPYEGTYQNLVGNMQHYLGDYQAAIGAYSRAIDAKPAEATYYSNLAQAWENVKKPGNRVQELDFATDALAQAVKLKPENRSYAQRLASLQMKKKLATQWGEATLNLVPKVNFLEVNVAPALLAFIIDSQSAIGVNASLQALSSAVRNRIRQKFGIVIPGITFRDITGAKSGTYVVNISEVPFGRGSIPSDKRFCPEAVEKLRELGIEYEEGINPRTGEKGCWVGQADWPQIEQRGLELWQVMEYPLGHLEAILPKNLAALIDHAQVMSLLENSEHAACLTFKQSPEKLIALIHVLKGLVDEEVPILALDQICEVVAELIETEADLQAIVEKVRSLPALLPTLPGNNDHYAFYQLSEHFEAELEQCVIKRNEQSLFIIEPQKLQSMLLALKDKIPAQKQPALVVANATLRPFVGKMSSRYYREIPALSLQELLPELKERGVEEVDLVHNWPIDSVVE